MKKSEYDRRITLKTLISIIVPVHNVENFLVRCIESILNQTYKELEIILVDDGSTDSCPNICKKYEEMDNRVVVITQENGGPSIARNNGIKCSKGEYIVFIDSDDFVTPTYIEKLFKTIFTTKSDIAITGFYMTDESGKIMDKRKNETELIEVYNTDEALVQLLMQKKIDAGHWAKMFKRDLFEVYKYPEGKLFEDFAIMYKLFLISEKVSYIDSVGYFYVQRENSILSTDFNPRKMDLIFFANEMFDTLFIEKPQLINYAGTRSFSALMSLWRTIPLSEKYNMDVWSEAIKFRKYPLKVRNSKIKYKIGAILTFFGVRISYRLMAR